MHIVWESSATLFLATAEKGEKVHEAIVQGLCDVIRAMRGVDLNQYTE